MFNSQNRNTLRLLPELENGMTISKCTYRNNYSVIKNNTSDIFICKNNALKSTLCKFHDPTYLTDTTREELESSFAELVRKTISKKKKLLCIGYHLSDIHIKDSFTESVYFNYSTFHGKINFENSEFSKDVQFLNCIFEKEVSFTGAIFRDDVYFSNSQFIGKQITMESTRFEQKIIFTKSVLPEALFTFTKFQETDFSNSVFTGEADFYYADFLNKTEFKRVNFQCNADFSYAKFKESINFEDSQFQSYAKFFRSRFHTQETNFVNARFGKKTDFYHAEFDGKTEFEKSHFEDPVDFSHSVFEKSVNFDNSEFLSYANFRKIHFFKNCAVFFDGDLSNVSFLETDITRIKFGNHTIWNKTGLKNGLSRKIGSRNSEFIILDERGLENKAERETQLESVMDVYRNLRDNYEYESRYDISGEFFVREMELKRKYTPNSNTEGFKTVQKNVLLRVFSLLFFYNLVAQYGQSYFRPVYMTIPILVFSTFYFWTNGFHNVSIMFQKNPILVEFNNALIRSLSAFFPFYAFDKYQRFSDLLLRIALLPISGTFFLALKRKLERQLRH